MTSIVCNFALFARICVAVEVEHLNVYVVVELFAVAIVSAVVCIW